MTEEAKSKIRFTVRHLVELLVARDYQALEKLSNSVRLKAEEIESGVLDYGYTLILPHQEAYDKIDIIPINNSLPSEYSIRFRLFTKEEGESDLEIQATLIESSVQDTMHVEIDNILVT
jgi:hypothetical protein